MISPLVTNLAADGVPVAVTCRVLKNSQARLLPLESQPGVGTGLAFLCSKGAAGDRFGADGRCQAMVARPEGGGLTAVGVRLQ